MEWFLTRGWDLILPGCGVTSGHSLSAISRWGWDFYIVQGGVDSGDRRVGPLPPVPSWSALCRCGGILELGIGLFSPRLRRNLDGSTTYG